MLGSEPGKLVGFSSFSGKAGAEVGTAPWRLTPFRRDLLQTGATVSGRVKSL